jgi:TAK1-binding protein 1
MQYELPVSGTGHSIHQVDLQPSPSLPDYHELQVPYYSFSTIENARYSLDFEREYSSLISKSDHPNDDRVFVINKEGNSTVLVVLDGHDGSNASSFAEDYMYDCLYKNDLSRAHNYMGSLLISLFLETENAFFQRIQKHIVRKRDIQQLLPLDMPSYQAYQLYPELVSELQDIEPLLAGGTTVVIAVVVDGVLYVANTGDSRAVLVRKTPDGTYSFEQLSTDHTVDNPDELKRLSDLGLNAEELKKAGRLGMQENTRCIGDYSIKKGYTEVDILRDATSPPGIADPTVTAPIRLDPSIKYLLLMTDGVYKSLEGLHDPPKSDTMSDLLKLIKSAELVCESNLGGLAAQVLDDIKLHHETTYYESAKSDPRSPLAVQCRKRDDMTLTVLYFGSSES